MCGAVPRSARTGGTGGGRDRRATTGLAGGRVGAGRHGAWVDRFGAEAGAPGTPRAPDSWGRGGVGPSGGGRSGGGG